MASSIGVPPIDVSLERLETAVPRVEVAPYFQWKGILDRVLAILLLIPGLPLIGLLLVLIRLTSRGPGIYRQVRAGRNGKRFTMYKLRSMRCDAEARTGPVWAQPGDARVTSLGRILRKLHLDDLPQLFNVLSKCRWWVHAPNGRNSSAC
jgi:lipopolysaccharide/colanic/teichoic acid biosynthesis glycosyltransferase